MRIRTLLAFGLGTAVGAGVGYLGDPDHGGARRVDARRWALTRGRQQGAVVAGTALQATRTWATAAVEGFRESAREEPPGV